MKVYYSTDTIPVFSKAVVTIGTFDGVHLGHRQILDQLKQEATRIGGETVIITFHPHPRKVIGSTTQPIQLINTIEEKIELLDKNGIHHLVVVPFTEEFAKQTPEEYIEHFLIHNFHPHTIIIGYDHRFGQGRKGDYRLLEEYSPKLGFQLKEIPAHVINENTVSSTRIRQAVMAGNTKEANALLGYDFFFEGLVVKGNQLGRTLGYPTANLQIADDTKLIPGNGVYAVEVEVRSKKSERHKAQGTRNTGPEGGNKEQGTRNKEQGNTDLQGSTHDSRFTSHDTTHHSPLTTHRGMMNIGVRPTVDGTKRVIEVNIFDFDADIYGQTLRVYVKHYLRAEQKFNGLDALKEQLAKDKEDAAAKLNA